LKITGLIWLDEILDKLEAKHNVRAEEVHQVFANRPNIRFVEKGHHVGENVYAAGGRTEAGRMLVVFFVHKTDGRALILSSRAISRRERRRYGL